MQKVLSIQSELETCLLYSNPVICFCNWLSVVITVTYLTIAFFFIVNSPLQAAFDFIDLTEIGMTLVWHLFFLNYPISSPCLSNDAQVLKSELFLSWYILFWSDMICHGERYWVILVYKIFHFIYKCLHYTIYNFYRSRWR